MYDCKLMEIRRAFFAGWMGCGALFFVVDGGWRMADAGRRGDGCRFAPGFVGGWLLGCRNSAKIVFQKSKLASCSRSDSGLLKNNADFRQPRISSPPAEADQTASPARAVRFKAVGLGWLGGSWMSRQRCAGRRGGKAEFPCGLMGRGWAEVLRCRLGVCRGASLSAGSVSNCGGIFGWVLRDFFSGVWYGWYIL